MEGRQVTLLSASIMAEEGDFESSWEEQKQIIIVRHSNGQKIMSGEFYFSSKT